MVCGISLQSVPCGLWEHLPAERKTISGIRLKMSYLVLIQHAYTEVNEDGAIYSRCVSGPLCVDSALSSHVSTNSSPIF